MIKLFLIKLTQFKKISYICIPLGNQEIKVQFWTRCQSGFFAQFLFCANFGNLKSCLPFNERIWRELEKPWSQTPKKNIWARTTSADINYLDKTKKNLNASFQIGLTEIDTKMRTKISQKFRRINTKQFILQNSSPKCKTQKRVTYAF